MKLSKLTQAVSIALTALALSACGGSDDGMIYSTDTTTPAPTPTTDSTTTPTAPTDAERLASIIAAAKAAGLNDTNAQKFAEAVKELAQDSEAYATALTAALEAQKIEIENATKPVSETVVKNNHFIFKVDATKELSSGSEFYIRQPGSTYDRTANKREVSGLGGIATDDPTGDNGNPWLSNFVLGVETFQGKLRAIDSTGEMALPIDSSNRGQKIGAAESLYAKRDGLRYNTTRTDKTRRVDTGYGYPNGRFPFYHNTNTDTQGLHTDDLALGRASGMIDNKTPNADSTADMEPIARNYDFDYDYSAVSVAPQRNEGWQASDVAYKNETWEKWWHVGAGSTDRRNFCKTPGQNGCDEYYKQYNYTWDNSSHPSYGDFDPWRNGSQILRGQDHEPIGGSDCVLTNFDCHNFPKGPSRRVKTGAATTKNVKSAHWTGNRLYRRHFGEDNALNNRANNLVDEYEAEIIASTGDYANAKDPNPNNTNDPIHQTTLDLVGQSFVNNLNNGRYNNYGLYNGHGSNYGTNPNQPQSVNANLEDAFGRKIYTIQEINRRKVKVSSEAVTDAETFAKFVGNQAAFAGLTTTSQAITAPGMRQDVAAGATAGNHSYKVNMDPYYTIRKQDGSVVPADIEKQRRYDTGLIVYSNHSKVVNGDERTYGYKKPIFGIEENVYVKDKDNKLKVVNHIYDETLLATLSNDSVKDPTKINDDPNSFFSVAKEKRIVYHQRCNDNSVSGPRGSCAPYEREGTDWSDNKSVATTRAGNAWIETDFDKTRRYHKDELRLNSTEVGLDVIDSDYGRHRGYSQFNDPIRTYTSIKGVDGTTWRRMTPWQRLTVLRESRNPLETGVDAAKVANNLETRVYGKNYRDLETGAEGYQDTHNSYVGNYETKTDADGKEIEHQMTKIVPEKLHHVQYGRITNNIDILTQAEMEKVKEDDEARIIYRQFQEHGAANSVDTYFYRGTNRTTMAQMEAVRAKGGVIDYRGHALTYNLGPIVEKANTIPTAYGQDHGATIGNFVQAKFDTATGKVDGSIYNFLNTDVSADANKFMRQDLVTFNGDVYGNTVTGTATKLGIKPEVGTLTASFYGESANELGGAVNSLTREQGYGDAKWGAVFGATRGTMVDQFNIIESNTPNRP